MLFQSECRVVCVIVTAGTRATVAVADDIQVQLHLLSVIVLVPPPPPSFVHCRFRWENRKKQYPLRKEINHLETKERDRHDLINVANKFIQWGGPPIVCEIFFFSC